MLDRTRVWKVCQSGVPKCTRKGYRDVVNVHAVAWKGRRMVRVLVRCRKTEKKHRLLLKSEKIFVCCYTNEWIIVVLSVP